MRAILILGMVVFVTPAGAQVKARFVDGTYVMSDQACHKLKKLAAGTPRSVSTVPWSLDAGGFKSWEGGCKFKKITELSKDREWLVEAACWEAAEQSKEIYTFVRRPDDTFSVRLKGEKTPRTYTRCDVAKGN